MKCVNFTKSKRYTLIYNIVKSFQEAPRMPLKLFTNPSLVPSIIESRGEEKWSPPLMRQEGEERDLFYPRGWYIHYASRGDEASLSLISIRRHAHGSWCTYTESPLIVLSLSFALMVPVSFAFFLPGLWFTSNMTNTRVSKSSDVRAFKAFFKCRQVSGFRVSVTVSYVNVLVSIW